MDLRVERLVVLLDAGINASPAADASRKVKAIAEQDISAGPLSADFNSLLVFFFVFLEAFQDLFQILFSHLLKCFWKKASRMRHLPCQAAGQFRKTERCTLEECPPVYIDPVNVFDYLFIIFTS